MTNPILNSNNHWYSNGQPVVIGPGLDTGTITITNEPQRTTAAYVADVLGIARRVANKSAELRVRIYGDGDVKDPAGPEDPHYTPPIAASISRIENELLDACKQLDLILERL